MRFPVLQQIDDYWARLRGAEAVPARAHLNPRDIHYALSACFVLERIAPGVARFRLAGSHLNDLMGMEVRGLPLSSIFLPGARERMRGALQQVFDSPAKAWITLSADRGIGKPPLDACLLLLPMRSDDGQVSLALGCLATLGAPGRRPRRFDVRSTSVTSIRLDGSIEVPETAPDRWPDGPRSPVAEVAGFAEAARSFRPSPHRPPRTERPNLYLVSNA
ncbi:MAG: PAS domain-containing protein [Tropicimonas sp.]|uniref:PAS domain-containing protein n=1 Tax=Tropicimonas sp. TaxID=2067044 RepID=UPI003A88460D